MSGSKSTRRVAIFGMDGADFALLRPWLKDNSLPCLARLYRNGAWGHLASTIPPYSPEAWSSFATGKNPGQHGVVNFVQPKSGSYELVFSTGATRRGKTFWQIAGEAGLAVGVINVPMTYPPQPVNGFMISGADTPGPQSEFVYPKELKAELLAAVGRYDLHGDYWGRTTPQEYLNRLIATVENHARAWQYLIERHSPDLFIGVFGSTDRAQHFLWRYSDPAHPSYDGAEFGAVNPLLAVYQAVDKAIGECLARLGDDVTVIIMSDHGGGPCNKAVYLDRWLQQQGLLVYKEEKQRLSRSLKRRCYESARAFLPRWAKDWAKAKWGEVRRQIEGSLLLDPIDWAHTRAFFLGTESAYVYLNVAGRFPQGIIKPGREAEETSRRIAHDLAGLVDPESGEPVVESVFLRGELYRGKPEELALLPDLVVNWRGGYVVRHAWGDSAAAPEVIIDPSLKAGEAGHLMSLELCCSHRPNGMLILSGPEIAVGKEIEGARIIDLAPSALALLGVRAPADMDGVVLSALPQAETSLQQSSAEAPPQVEPAPGGDPYTEAEKQEMEQRLRALGYLE